MLIPRLRCPLAAALVLLLTAPAWAHGGQYQGPGGRRAPGDPTVPPPPAPRKGPAPTTPGSGIPTTGGAFPDTWWGTWWGLNRWLHLPERGAQAPERAPVTGGAEPQAPPLDMDEELRALLVRQQVRPFLESLLDARPQEEPEIRAAALLALAKVDASKQTLDLLLKVAGDSREEPVVQESAALAVGLLRRTQPELQLDGLSLDLARMQLLDLAKAEKVDLRTRCFALLSTGLLSDQPHATEFSKDGRLVVRELMELLARRPSTADLPVAALVALSLQPRAGVPGGVHELLRAVVARGEAQGRRWTDLERAHAVTVLARVWAPQWLPVLLRLLSDRRTPSPLARAARLALAERAADLDPPQRLDAVQALLKAEAGASDNLSVGLGRIAAARLLGADLAAGHLALLHQTPLRARLLGDTDTGAFEQRGFHVLALALAARRIAGAQGEAAEFLAEARARLRRGLASGRDPDVRSAYAVGLGLAQDETAGPALLELVGDPNAGGALRAQAALALFPAGVPATAAVPGLRALLLEDRAIAPRGAAALGLAFYRSAEVTEQLGEELRAATSQVDRVQVAIALGQTRDPKAIRHLMQLAKDETLRQEVRALAIASLGILADPEPRPSLLRLSADANYVGRTDALNEAFSIL